MVRNSKKDTAIELRLEGKSYGEIMKILGISSKGTLSYWFRNITLSAQAQKRLSNNVKLAQKRGLFSFNQKRTEIIKNENTNTLYAASKEVPPISHKELLLIGAALYWAEGVNREPTRGYRNICFTNSDPKMVEIFMHYLTEVLKVNPSKIKPGIILYPNLDIQKTKEFWADTLKLPKDSFWTSIAVSKASKFKRAPNYLPYGTVQIRVHNRKLFYQIQGHIQGIIKQIQYN